MAEGQSPTEDLKVEPNNSETHLDSVQIVRMGSD